MSETDYDCKTGSQQLSQWKCELCTSSRRESVLKSSVSSPRQSSPSGTEVSTMRSSDAVILEKIARVEAQTSLIPEYLKSVEYCSQKIDDVLRNMNSLIEENKKHNQQLILLSEEVQQLKRQVKAQDEIINDLQQRMRVNNIEITGIPESVNEDVETVLSSLAQAIGVDFKPEDVERAHRVPAMAKGRPSPIVVRFQHYKSKLKWVQAFRPHKFQLTADRLAPAFPKDLKVFVSDHLSPSNKHLLFEARKYAKANNYKFVWWNGHSVMLRKDESAKFIRVNEDQLKKLLNS